MSRGRRAPGCRHGLGRKRRAVRGRGLGLGLEAVPPLARVILPPRGDPERSLGVCQQPASPLWGPAAARRLVEAGDPLAEGRPGWGGHPVAQPDTEKPVEETL